MKKPELIRYAAFPENMFRKSFVLAMMSKFWMGAYQCCSAAISAAMTQVFNFMNSELCCACGLVVTASDYGPRGGRFNSSQASIVFIPTVPWCRLFSSLPGQNMNT